MDTTTAQQTMDQVECLPCSESFPTTDGGVTLPCGDFWCRGCLEARYTLARNEVNYPVRCCQPIDFASIQHVLSDDLAADLQVRVPEFETLPQHRIYCAFTDCHRFIPNAQDSSENVTCLSCGKTTCVQCKGQQHEGPCPTEITSDQASLQEASTALGYKTCPKCQRSVIDKNGGCAHVTCPLKSCRHDFCFFCLQAWRECNGNCPVAVQNMHVQFGGVALRRPPRPIEPADDINRHNRDLTGRHTRLWLTLGILRHRIREEAILTRQTRHSIRTLDAELQTLARAETDMPNFRNEVMDTLWELRLAILTHGARAIRIRRRGITTPDILESVRQILAELDQMAAQADRQDVRDQIQARRSRVYRVFFPRIDRLIYGVAIAMIFGMLMLTMVWSFIALLLTLP